MKKITIIIAVILLIGSAAGAVYTYLQMQEEPESIHEEVINVIEGTTLDDTETELHSEDVKDRLSILRNRVKLKDLIKNGDKYAESNDYVYAVINYQKALKQSPDDKGLILKIADAYYDMFNFKKAYTEYAKIKDFENLDKKKAIYALINSKGAIPSSKEEVIKEIKSYNLSDEEEFYYLTSYECAFDDEKCRTEFEAYFATAGAISFNDLKNIKQAFINYENFESKELYYKATYVSSAFYQNGFYFVALKTAEKVASMKKGYQPVLKVAALSAYEIGKYVEAKKYLLELKKLNSHDAEISYFTARIYEKLREDSLAVVHYKKAIKEDYTDKADIYRRMIFLYHENENDKQMLEAFDDLLKISPKYLTSTDYSLAIYYNILNENNRKAEKYARKATILYKDTEVFYGYLAWLILLKDNQTKYTLEAANRYITKAEEIEKNSAIVLMTHGIYEYKINNKNKAIVFLKKAHAADTSWEYKEEIEYYLNKLKK